ncbi:hypothetical protein [Undibacterium oligocarboniphilum]|uniref:Uncharacterized protein n=1 Tax=Undibacterium oligocarboniphilum TaxID=666702 RepID=A0A850QNJ0_9BURK|nr:hypothetical protein [Undibacterium oligocarboniphilum]MBC3871481.1 hypothetical protein [Undibacterium oligocarboniphilum]NVO78943.1 hypothetical protein [Undibacterium oligocarboniphilum]
MYLPIIEQYGYTESGLLALAIQTLAGANTARLCAVQAYGFSIHYCCRIGNDLYLHAWGCARQHQLIQRTCQDLPAAVLQIVEIGSSGLLSQINAIQPQEFIEAKTAAKQLFALVSAASVKTKKGH